MTMGDLEMQEDRTQGGPAMQALPNERWREFVRWWLRLGGRFGERGRTGRGCECARRAGFKGTNETLRRQAYALMHDERIQRAVQEEARRWMVGSLPAALHAVDEIVADKAHKDRLSAAKTVLDRAGVHEVSETKHTHEFIGNNPLLVEKVRQLAERLNIPVEKLLGRSITGGLAAPTPVDVEFAPVSVEQKENE